MRVLALSLLVTLGGCSTAFEIGEALNRATSNIASDPARYLWSREPVNAEPVQPVETPASAVPAVP